MYDGGIVYTDDLLGRLIEALRRRGTLDRTILVVLSDHGEMLGEHGEYGHGAAMYEPGIRVPLLVRYPPAVPAGARVATPVSTVGVFATVLDLAGIESTAPLHVRSLVPAISGGPPAGPVLSERHIAPAFAAEDPSPLADRSVRIRTYRAGSWKLVETSAGGLFLFDLAGDPDETTNLATARPDQLERLRGELETWRGALALPAIDATVERGEPPEIDPEAQERLRALGYVE
jgi:choline-sulfatase